MVFDIGDWGDTGLEGVEDENSQFDTRERDCLRVRSGVGITAWRLGLRKTATVVSTFGGGGGGGGCCDGRGCAKLSGVRGSGLLIGEVTLFGAVRGRTGSCRRGWVSSIALGDRRCSSFSAII